MIIIEQTDEDGTIIEFEFSDDMRAYKSYIKETEQYHSFGDKPAIVYASGYKCWYKNGKFHRENDQPAVVYPHGVKYWYKNDKLHRDNDQPAIVYVDGSKVWYKNGKLVKAEGPTK